MINERTKTAGTSSSSRANQSVVTMLASCADWLSLTRKSAEVDIWRVVGIAAIMGAVYGIFVHPVWASEAVEFGQALAGIVDYQKSPWGSMMFADPSLQITVPALLLLAGVQFWTLSVVATAFFCALSFSAVAAASFAFNRNIAVSLLSPLLLLSYTFVNSHGYTVLYPVAASQFGQTGLYITVLGLSLLACGWPVAAGILGGILSGAHAVWCLCFVVSAVPATVWLQREALKRLLVSFVVAAAAALASLFWGNSLMPPKIPYQAPSLPPSSVSAPQASKSVNPVIQKDDKADGIASGTRIRAASHNVLFADAPTPPWAAATFFLPSMLFIMLGCCFYFAGRTTAGVNDGGYVYARRLVGIVAVPVGLIFLFKVVEELDPHFTVLGVIHPKLPALALRAIFNRWLNLTTVLIPLMTISVLAILSRDRASKVGTLGLITLLVYATLRSHWALVPAQEANNVWLLPAAFDEPFTAASLKVLAKTIFVVGVFCGLLLVARKANGGAAPGTRQIHFIVTAAIIGCGGFKLAQLTYAGGINVFVNHRLSTSDAYDPIVNAATQDKGPMFVAPDVLGGAFYPQLRTGRPMIVPSIMDVYDEVSQKRIHVFCNEDPMLPLPKFYDNVKACFEGRTEREWEVIGRETSATGLLTPDSWQLSVKPVITGGGVAYYRITASK